MSTFSGDSFMKLVVSVLALTVVDFIYNVVRRSRHLKDLPGPPSESFIMGNIADIKAAPVGTRYNVWQRRYGRAYKINGALSETILILSDPKAISYVLSSNASNYKRPKLDRYVLQAWFGNGLFSAEGAEHKRMRRSLNGAFTPQAVKEISPVLFDLADRLKSQWEEVVSLSKTPSTLNVSSSLHMLSLDAISMTTFGARLSDGDFSASSSPSVVDLMHKITNPPSSTPILLEVLVSKFPQLLNLPSEMKSWATLLRKELGAIAEKVWNDVESGRCIGGGKRGLHTKVLELIDESHTTDGEAISREEAIAHIIGILFAGSESTANVISECLYELSRHPNIQTKLREELLNFESTPGHGLLYEDLMSVDSLPYLDAVVREACRMKPVLMEISRVAVKADFIPLSNPLVLTGTHEVRVEPGQVVNISVRDGVNVDERAWGPDAEEFKPERWLTELEEEGKNAKVLTFGDGPKVCLGRLFAIAEMKIVISTLLRSFVLEPPGLNIELDFYHLGGNTVKPKIRGREKEGVQMPLRVRMYPGPGRDGV